MSRSFYHKGAADCFINMEEKEKTLEAEPDVSQHQGPWLTRLKHDSAFYYSIYNESVNAKY